MSKEKIIIVDLGFGDQGKGTTIDFLADRLKAELVIRYLGGPQTAHNVVEPEGRHHTFAQFGSGTFVGAKTHLSYFMSINPLELEAEAEALMAKGINNPFDLITFDAHSLIVTPFHVHLNRMREIARGRKRNGSCGKGFGETIRDARNNVSLRFSDFGTDGLQRKMDFLWRYKIDQAEQIVDDNSDNKELIKFLHFLKNKDYVKLLVEAYDRILTKHQLKFRPTEIVLEEAKGTLIFEGAQGVLLDERFGFYPHITHSNTTSENADMLIAGSQAKARRIGILRVYATRHGAGPFVTEDRFLTETIPDVHNKLDKWQQKFRIGWFDLVTARYALAVGGKIDELALTCLDRLDGMEEIKVCTAYEYKGRDRSGLDDFFHFEKHKGRIRINGIKPDFSQEKNDGRLAKMMFSCRPLEWKIFRGWKKSNNQIAPEMAVYINYIQSAEAMGVPVSIVSLGPTRNDKIVI